MPEATSAADAAMDTRETGEHVRSSKETVVVIRAYVPDTPSVFGMARLMHVDVKQGIVEMDTIHVLLHDLHLVRI